MTFVLCSGCGVIYDQEDYSSYSEHTDCLSSASGDCCNCNTYGSNMVFLIDGPLEHRDVRECLANLKQRLKSVEEGLARVVSGSQLLELEVENVLVGRRAAIDESRVLKALRGTDEI